MRVGYFLCVFGFISFAAFGTVSEVKQRWILNDIDFGRLDSSIVSIRFNPLGNVVVLSDGTHVRHNSQSNYNYEVRLGGCFAELLTDYPDELISGYMMEIINREIKQEVSTLGVSASITQSQFMPMGIMVPHVKTELM